MTSVRLPRRPSPPLSAVLAVVLALTSEPSYAAYFGTENVLAEKLTLTNRVNQIYNDDLAISLRLVNETDKLNLDTAAEAMGANGPCGAHPWRDASRDLCCDQVPDSETGDRGE